ncbi:MAG: hypothetical protein Kow0098_01870 [Ignavibacteriaceae bacterium]
MTEVSIKITDYIRNLYGDESAIRYASLMEGLPDVTIRVNRLKAEKSQLENSLKNYNITLQQIEEIPFALKVTSGKETISKTIEHILGMFYIQSLSSMLPPLVLNPLPGESVLDLCAAPGSKTTLIAELMNNTGTIAANEAIPDRVKSLTYNLDKQSIINSGVINLRGETLSRYFLNHFDKVLVDAPCSGLGIIQKKSEINNWWSEDHVRRLSELQYKLLVAAIKSARVGGEIVYSTCTLTVEENEMIIDKVLKKFPVEVCQISLPFHTDPGFSGYGNLSFDQSVKRSLRLLPWEINSEGFYIVKLMKTEPTPPTDKQQPKQDEIRLLSLFHRSIKDKILKLADWFGISSDVLAKFKFIINGKNIYFVNSDWQMFNSGIFHRIGSRFGLIDKKGEIVLHTHAAQVLGRFITKNIYTLDGIEEFKSYIEGASIKKQTGLRGQCLISYKGYLLGTASAGSEGIKSRFPRAKRTQSIIKEF